MAGGALLLADARALRVRFSVRAWLGSAYGNLPRLPAGLGRFLPGWRCRTGPGQACGSRGLRMRAAWLASGFWLVSLAC
jgi:hypothetical protein